MGIIELISVMGVAFRAGTVKGSDAKLDSETLLVRNLTRQSFVAMFFKGKQSYIRDTTTPMTMQLLDALQKGKKNEDHQK